MNKEFTCKVKADLRPCYVHNEKALFHKWVERVTPLIGGHNGSIYQRTYGLIEFEDGSVAEVYLENIKFCDNLIDGYAFIPQKEGANNG